jgi:four helix bundle protein
MKTVSRFEDLLAWQKARGVTKAIYQVTRERGFARDLGLCSQMQRAAVSIMSNIAEAFERNRSGEFHQFLSIAKGSCAELRSHLYVALDTGYLSEKKFHELLAQAEEVARIVGGLRAAVESRKRAVPGSSASQHSALSTQHSL